MNQILGELGKSQKFKELLNQIENKQSPIAISGLNDVGAVQIETGGMERHKPDRPDFPGKFGVGKWVDGVF